MKTVQTSGGDLYRLALQQLGDATQWSRIVQANYPASGGLPMDPFLNGNLTLNIPSPNSLLTGGVLVL